MKSMKKFTIIANTLTKSINKHPCSKTIPALPTPSNFSLIVVEWFEFPRSGPRKSFVLSRAIYKSNLPLIGWQRGSS